MKRYIITLVIVFGLGMGLNAQNDGFFTSSYSEYRDTEDYWGTNMPNLPRSHGGLDDYQAVPDVPLSSGLLLLSGLGLAYISMKKKNKIIM